MSKQLKTNTPFTIESNIVYFNTGQHNSTTSSSIPRPRSLIANRKTLTKQTQPKNHGKFLQRAYFKAVLRGSVDLDVWKSYGKEKLKKLAIVLKNLKSLTNLHIYLRVDDEKSKQAFLLDLKHLSCYQSFLFLSLRLTARTAGWRKQYSTLNYLLHPLFIHLH